MLIIIWYSNETNRTSSKCCSLFTQLMSAFNSIKNKREKNHPRAVFQWGRLWWIFLCEHHFSGAGHGRVIPTKKILSLCKRNTYSSFMKLYKTNGVLRRRYVFVSRILRMVGIRRRVTKQLEIVSMAMLAKKNIGNKGTGLIAAQIIFIGVFQMAK